MKIKLYTTDRELQEISGETSVQQALSSREWSLNRSRISMDQNHIGNFESREGIISQINPFHTFIAGKLGERLAGIGAREVLSLASGPTYYEYLIKQKNPEIRITVSDFDPFIVDAGRRSFPEYESHLLIDIKKEDFSAFHGMYDTVIMISSLYVLDDKEVVSFLRNVHRTGASHLLLCLASFVDMKRLFQYYFDLTLRSVINVKKRLQNTPPIDWGRFHGWGRTDKSIRALVKKSGVFIVKDFELWRHEVLSSAFYHLVTS